MVNRMRAAIAVLGALLGPAAAVRAVEPGDLPQALAPPVREFLDLNPGVQISQRGDRTSRVYGTAFSFGPSARASAEQFRLAQAQVFGAEPADLVAASVFGGTDEQPVMYRPQDGSYKFTLVTYQQQRGGIPVFRGRLKLLCRNVAGSPLVLASATVRDLGNFHVNRRTRRAAARAGDAAALARAAALSPLAGIPRALSSRDVIWAGAGAAAAAPRLARETIVGIDADRWLVLTDVASGAVLYEEQLVVFEDVTGIVEGRATEGLGAEQCEEEVAMPLPYLGVSANGVLGFTGPDGTFDITTQAPGDVTVDAVLDGTWFDVHDFNGQETSESQLVSPPDAAALLFNAANDDEFVRSQVNGYVNANVVRDYVLLYNPSYPTLGWGNFDVWVNRTDGFCPGNAWWDGDINFCQSNGADVNTAFASVIYHEYGHNLVWAGGSGQGAYGEGMGDVISTLVLDSPLLAVGFHGSCAAPLRNAANNCQYLASGCSTCGSEAHACGNLLSGAVWSTRNELAATEPGPYRDIISALAINSILLHNGSSINGDIAIDFLTLDDDDGDFCNQTPHFDEIAAGFGAHGLFDGEVNFTFPGGLPALVDTVGGDQVTMTVSCLPVPPKPDSGVLHVDTGGGFQSIPMDDVGLNAYQASLPPAGCGAVVRYYFTVETIEDVESAWPPGSPDLAVQAIAADMYFVAHADTFDTDGGWTAEDLPGLTDGGWELGQPVGGGNRGDPAYPVVGQMCWLTGNADGDSDVDGGATVLTSPVLDATAGDEMLVRYWRWYDNSFGANPFADVMEVEVSDDGGATWVPLETVGPDGPEVGGGWFRRVFRLSDVVDLTDQFRIRFTASDEGAGSIVEAGVDYFQLLSATCEMVADVNGDGMIGVDDLLAMFAAWGPCPGCGCPEDINGDCAVGVEDFLILLAHW